MITDWFQMFETKACTLLNARKRNALREKKTNLHINITNIYTMSIYLYILYLLTDKVKNNKEKLFHFRIIYISKICCVIWQGFRRRTIRKSQISRKVAAVFRDPKTDLMIEDFLKKINETWNNINIFFRWIETRRTKGLKRNWSGSQMRTYFVTTLFRIYEQK